MKRYLLDSGIASDFVQRRTPVFQRCRYEREKGNLIGIGVPILAEMAAGIEYSSSRDRNMRIFVAALPNLKIWPFDSDAAFEYAQIYAELTRSGRPIGVVDMMVAAISLTLPNCTVVTADSDFEIVPRLRVENWRSLS